MLIIFEDRPGAWRWVFRNSRGIILATCAREFGSPQECMEAALQLASAPFAVF
jgi:hypothetical protein